MKKIFVLITFVILLLFGWKTIAQEVYFDTYGQINITPQTIDDDSEKRKVPSFIYKWENNISKDINGNYHFVLTNLTTEYTCFGIGVDVGPTTANLDDFSIDYRFPEGDGWSEWRTVGFHVYPNETPTKLFWSDLIFTYDGEPANGMDFRVHIPEDEGAISIRMDVMDISKSKALTPVPEIKSTKANGCPPLPTVIGREVWLHPYYGTQSYTPTVIYPTHVVIHHGASPDTYTDGEAVVRGYWNYHVNSNGWSDIGYNFLCDKYGNLYQGRKNSDIEGQDVRGAHAGASNDESIGFNFLGNADVTLPTGVQLDACESFLGWWFETRGYDPTSSAVITLQSGGSASKYRICGHKDVNVGGTACPGTTLEGMLPDIRLGTKAVIDACTPVAIPSTSVSVSGIWQTNDFIADFTDVDSSGQGFQYLFYDVLDWNGSEWRANDDFGFFNDNFDNTIHSDWTQQVGTWSINAGAINQTDEASTNSNIHIPVAQTSGDIILYHFSMNIGGSGANRRAGFHFFCDDPALTQRGNSYMVYWRVDNNKCQIYKSVNDAITLYTDDNCTVDLDTWYDYKVIINTTSGEISAYQNDVLVSAWTDPSPLANGNSISLRTGECNVLYENLKVYKDRNASEVVSIGSVSDEVRYQNPDPLTPACRVKSIVVDVNNKWSSLEGVDANIDWTPPADVVVSDGLAADIDITYDNTQLSANWTASADANSDIASYWYCIGDSPGNNNVVDWIDNGLNLNVTHSSLSLNFGTTYYVSIKSENGAGLFSGDISSDGMLVQSSVTDPVAGFTYSTTTICEGGFIYFTNTSQDAVSYEWTFIGGAPSASIEMNPYASYTAGTYDVQLIAFGSGDPDTLVQSITVNTLPHATAAFSASGTTFELPSASVTYTNSSTDADSYEWLFGDGGSSSDVNPTYEYTTAGIYTITLIAINSQCDNDTLIVTDYITVNETVIDPIAGFTYSSTIICEGGLVSFTNTSQDASSYVWSFSGGTPASSTDENPEVSFTTGTYDVQLIAIGAGDPDTLLQSISVTVIPPVIAGFSSTGTNLTLPTASVTFTNSSANADSYSWQFGDGGVSTDTDPVYTYTSAGVYTVTLIAVSDQCDNDTIIMVDYITVTDPAGVAVAGFVWSSSDICSGDSIYFINNSSNTDTWLWSFPGGDPTSSNDENPVVWYPDGTYTVELIASSGGDSDTVSHSFTITTGEFPLAAFSAIETDLIIPDATAFFINNSTGSESYTWNFGDSGSSTDVSPWHEYTAVGDYTVTLIATNSCGDDTLVQSNFIHVIELAEPVAAFSWASAMICENESVQFTNSSTDAQTYAWIFENGSPETSTDENPLISLPDGSHNVTLIATGAGGSDTLSQTITVTLQPLPVASFYAQETQLQLQSPNAFFVNTSSNSDSYIWDFGDGSTSTDAGPWHAYADSGHYTVALIAISNDCDNDTTVMQDYIYVEWPSGIAENETDQTLISPNPFSDEFIVVLNADSELKVHFEIYDMLGKAVFVQDNMAQKGSNSYKLSGNQLSQGVYYLKVQTGEKQGSYLLIRD